MLTVCRFCWIASCAMHWSFFLAAASRVGLCFRMWRHIRRVLLQCSAIRSILLLYFVPVSLHCPAILGSLRCISTLVASKCMKKKRFSPCYAVLSMKQRAYNNIFKFHLFVLFSKFYLFIFSTVPLCLASLAGHNPVGTIPFRRRYFRRSRTLLIPVW